MRLLETDSLTNQNLSSALAIGAYTADAARVIYARIFADAVAGNGDYVAYLTIQRGGSGSAYRLIPITTAEAASGVTAIALSTIAIPVSSGDVVTCYLTGLAGDTTTPDTACEWWEDDSLRPATADRTLTVDASGYTTVGSNTDKTGYETTATDKAALADVIWSVLLTAITTVGSIGTLIKDYLDAAISSRLATASYSAAPTAAAVADQVWDEAIGDHAGAGSTGAALSGATAPTAASVADAVWDEAVADHAGAGSTGYNLGLADDIKAKTDTIGAVSVTVSSPVADDCDVETYQGDDYSAAAGRSLEWTGGASWPDLTSATIKIVISNVVELDGAVITPTGDSKLIRLELTDAQSKSIRAGRYAYRVIATLDGGDVATLLDAWWTSLRRIGG